MDSGLIKIEQPAGGFAHDVNEILQHQCKVYVAKGYFAESDIPTTVQELIGLYNGETAVFVPFGQLDGGGSNIKWEPNKYQTDFHEIQLNVKVTGTLVNLNVTPEMIDFIDDSSKDKYSFLFVPEGIDTRFLALSGVTISHEGVLPIVGENEIAKITITLSRRADKITHVLKYKKLPGPGI